MNQPAGGAPLGAVSVAGVNGQPTSPASQPASDADGGDYEHGYPVWRIACGDMINRDRAVVVYVDGSEVVVVGPPGESARLSGTQLNELKTALDEAATLAER